MSTSWTPYFHHNTYYFFGGIQGIKWSSRELMLDTFWSPRIWLNEGRNNPKCIHVLAFRRHSNIEVVSNKPLQVLWVPVQQRHCWRHVYDIIMHLPQGYHYPTCKRSKRHPLPLHVVVRVFGNLHVYKQMQVCMKHFCTNLVLIPGTSHGKLGTQSRYA